MVLQECCKLGILVAWIPHFGLLQGESGETMTVRVGLFVCVYIGLYHVVFSNEVCGILQGESGEKTTVRMDMFVCAYIGLGCVVYSKRLVVYLKGR